MIPEDRLAIELGEIKKQFYQLRDHFNDHANKTPTVSSLDDPTWYSGSMIVLMNNHQRATLARRISSDMNGAYLEQFLGKWWVKFAGAVVFLATVGGFALEIYRTFHS